MKEIKKAAKQRFCECGHEEIYHMKNGVQCGEKCSCNEFREGRHELRDDEHWLYCNKCGQAFSDGEEAFVGERKICKGGNYGESRKKATEQNQPVQDEKATKAEQDIRDMKYMIAHILQHRDAYNMSQADILLYKTTYKRLFL